ncbi:class I tRNA ligase family protein [Tamlana sp. 2_MG-2023]|uniref:leucine--tRNA ligase n=1 Tax=unclassified Tamlana TaxID=2614803 RepID=UPI0026E296A6|nr:MULTISPECIES: class I tRNA ligase family protein [unclassified Tamlana]MDO6760614.1 class I tRNA ligase family protein [Tamlana sp. 2_MG-2023]MDO6790870.1 class I tRNA ligase family protein [Tamlana sp. 1_MG-2023]
MTYNFNEIDAKWQKYWAENQTFKAVNNSKKPKYYVLDMFPYPSGAGLHVGHPLGYIASDIYARYKRHQGFNVLHPQGYDSFGLPAEQYAIQTGQHPALTTAENIKTYRRQLDQIGFSFDWSREVRTSDPSYYKWTQWIFIQLFNSWFNNNTSKAEEITELEKIFASEGNANVNAVCDDNIEVFSAEEWNGYTSEKQQKILLQYRLTYLAETEVNWCPALGTVLANDEIVNGVSERGGHTVVRKKMTQWSMRISAYAERLLQGLDTIDWTDSLKESQRNWIGKSVGASVTFNVIASETKQSHVIDVFTTRPDTIFGVSFMTLAPEHDLVSQITTPEQKADVEAYILATAKRSERDRMADVKTISGAFTGAYAEHPFTKEPIPVWIGDYVLAGYGTGAVMSVPCGDQRDYDFAKHFNIPIINIFSPLSPKGGTKNSDDLIAAEAFTEKDGFTLKNSGFLDGMNYKKATKRAIYELEQLGFGEGKTNYRLRDAVFSRQRYWGEPFPVYYVDGMPQMIAAEHLPIRLPEVEKYLPTETGEPPLGNATVWAWDTTKNEVVSNDLIDDKTVFALELNTMPGWAGSSWYFNRYMDSTNENEFASQEALNYWKDVDLYIGGSEHATGHLLYSRFWQKFLFDKGVVPVDEFAKKLINQGMILGTSAFVYRVDIVLQLQDFKWTEDKTESPYLELHSNKVFISYNLVKPFLDKTENVIIEDKILEKKIIEIISPKLKDKFKKALKETGKELSIKVSNLISPIHADVSFVNASDELDIDAFKNWRKEFKDAEFILENGVYKVGRDVEKMSKSKYNVVNPDDIVADYGADSLRLYEMFLGPLEQYKPWNTAGITGVHNFLKKLWKLYVDDNGIKVNDAEASKDALKTLHKTIKKVQEDIENFSFNTSVSTFMIAVNELTTQKCTSKDVLEPLLVLISPYAPHIAEELWSLMGNEESISTAAFPEFDASHLVESAKNYPISFNGKMRFTLELPLDMSKEAIETTVLAHEKTQEQLQGRTPKKVIVVPGKIVNIVG